MAQGVKDGKVNLFANWKGIEERPQLADNTTVQQGFNVDFIDGTICRRKGRTLLMSPTSFKPSVVLWQSGGTTWTDVTAACTDGDPTTAAITGAFNSANALVIGAPFRFTGISFTLTSGNNTNVTTTSVLPSDYTVVFNSSFVITDTTIVASKSFAQSGTITWAASGWSSGSGWSPGTGPIDPITAGGDKLNISRNLYYVTITSSNSVNVNISEISLLFTGSDGIRLLGDSSGMSEFVTRSGDRYIVSVNSIPSVNNDSHLGLPPDVKVLSYDLTTGTTSTVYIGPYGRKGTRRSAKTSFVTFNGFLIGSTPVGKLWKYDGTSSGELEAMAGNDYINGVVGARGYLNTAPLGKYLDVYHSKLMVAGSPVTPLTFYASMPDNDINNIPGAATVGGPNVWPIDTTYTIQTKEGDYITGTGVVNDRYVIFTRAQTWVFDETSLRLANGDVGCIAPGSVQRIDENIFFLSERGVFTHDSVNAKLISGPIEQTLGTMVNWKAVENSATSAHYASKGEYWLWLPINGDWQNKIAVVFNYIKQYWRIVGGWYPFDTNARIGTNFHGVSAACQALGSDGRRKLLSINQNGDLYQEDTGYDDNGFIYPAYAVLHQLSSWSNFLAQSASAFGENYVMFREWYVNVTMDGGWLECIPLEDGERFDQELDRHLNGVALNSEWAQKQSFVQNAVSSNQTQLNYGTVAGWPVNTPWSQPKKVKFSFRRNVTKIQPVLHWPGGQFVTNNYNTAQVAAKTAIFDVQIGSFVKPGGR